MHDHIDLRSSLATKHTFEDMCAITEEFKKRLLVSSGGEIEYILPTDHSTSSESETSLTSHSNQSLNSYSNGSPIKNLPSWVCQPHLRVPLPPPSENDVQSGAQNTESLTSGPIRNINETVASINTSSLSVDVKANLESHNNNTKPIKSKRLRSESDNAEGLSPEILQLRKLEAKKAKRKAQSKPPLCEFKTCANIASKGCAFLYCKSCCRNRGAEGLNIVEVNHDTANKPDADKDQADQDVVGDEKSGDEKNYLCEAHKTFKLRNKQ